jgi:DNA-binding response OmpR family regulator
VTRHILLVDDDALLRRSLAFNLEQAGYRVSTAANAENALTRAAQDHPDLVLLDIGLPGMNGLDALQHFRARMNVPVIFLTARDRRLDEALGLELGADDYVAKPFDMAILLARIKAVLRRYAHSESPSPPESGTLTVGDLMIDPVAHTVTVGGRPVDLPRLEFDILHELALNAGGVVSVDELLAQVWGAEYEGESQVVYVHMRWLRDRLEEDPHHPRRIVTVRNVGYKLVAQEE